MPKNVFPDPEGITESTVKEEDVKTSPETEEIVTPETLAEPIDEEVEAVDETPSPKGSKTPETQLYSKLKEEREKRKEVERELRELKESSVSSDEEGITDIEKELRTVTTKLTQLERKDSMRELLVEFPALADKRSEFDDFLEEDEAKALSLPRAAKLFLLENGLLTSEKPKRKGLESPVGGSKAPTSSGYSFDDLKRLRETQPKKYAQMLREGKIKLENVT